MNIKATAVKRIGYCREIEKSGADEVLRRCRDSFMPKPPRALHRPHIGTEVAYMHFQPSIGVYLHLYVVPIFSIYRQPIDLILYYKVYIAQALLSLQKVVSNDAAEDIHISLRHYLTEYGRSDGVHHLITKITQKSTVCYALYIFIEITKYVVH